jgi:hypothetical protein
VTELPDIDPSRSIMIEFGTLTDDQRRLVETHPLRATGIDPLVHLDQGWKAAFWFRQGRFRDEVYDEIKGWAVGNRLPIRGVLDE